MAIKMRHKNPLLKKLMADLERQGRKSSGIWKSVAEGLNKPRRQMFEVSLYDLERTCRPGETVVVPGKVLGKGGLSKAVTIAAISFSEGSRKGIESAGGKAVGIRELMDSNPDGRGIRILG